MQRLRPSSRGQPGLGVHAPVPQGLRGVGPRPVQALLRQQPLAGIAPLPAARAQRRVQVGVPAHGQQGMVDPRRDNQAAATARKCGTDSGTGWFGWHSPGRLSRRRRIPLVGDKYTPHARSAGRRGSLQDVQWLVHR